MIFTVDKQEKQVYTVCVSSQKTTFITEENMSDSMGTREAARLWGCTQQSIQAWCRAGMIPGADQDKKGSPWRIPKNAVCPLKARNKKFKQENK